jgi:hypothetical protein
MSQHATNEHIIRVITLYDKLNLDKENIKNGVSVIFSMDNSKFHTTGLEFFYFKRSISWICMKGIFRTDQYQKLSIRYCNDQNYCSFKESYK